MSSRVTLEFENDAAKHVFMSQLCDGWGENWVDLEWPGMHGPTPGEAFDRATVFRVEVFPEDE